MTGTVIAGEWARLRAQPDVVLLDGFHAVKHALRFGADVLTMITADRTAALSLATALAPDLTGALDALVDVDQATFAQLSGTGRGGGPAVSRAGDSAPAGGHRTGVAALARRAAWELPPLASAERAAPLVFLDGPRHLGNHGAVIRVAAGLGASGVVSTGTVDPWHPTVLRGAAGLHYAVPVLRLDGDGDGVAALDGPVIGLDAGGRDARDATIPANAVLAFGSERHGLSPQVRRRADDLRALPMRPGVASYNLASAVAMVLYQWRLSAPREHGPPPQEHRP